MSAAGSSGPPTSKCLTAKESEVERHLFEALASPIRRGILREMDGEGQISPKECADLMGVHLSVVSYHFRKLAVWDVVVLVDIKPARGAEQHFYRLAIDTPWAREALGFD
jgi:predicted transcriptional regulator